MPARRSRTRRTVALIATATAVVGVALTAPVTAHANPANCASTFNLFIPGTWETNENADPNQPVGMLAPVAAAIEAQNGARAQIYTLPYMASAFDNGHTYADSKTDAVSKATAVLKSYVDECRGAKITITGYSQGADAAGDLASAIGNDQGPVDADQVLGVALLADPGAGTKGAATVGPTTSGEGIAGPRSQGMGTLAGRVASICDPNDLYCSIRKGANPFLGSLGSILSKTPGNTGVGAGGGNGAVATALTSDFTDADLPGLGSSVDALGRQLRGTDTGGSIDVHQIADTATSLSKTLSPLVDLLQSGAANTAATARLAAAPVGTPENAAAQVLTTASQANLAGALDSAATIANTATNLANNGTTTLPATAPEISQLAGTAASLGSQIAPVAATPADALSSASSVLSVLKPTVVVDQALNVLTSVTALDIPKILHNLIMLPQKIAAGDVRAARDTARELNVQLSPLVKMAAGVDLKWISHILAIIPDPSGYTQIAALVTSILGNVDVIRLANIAGRAQEIAWAAADKLFPPPGVLPDPVGAAAQTTALLPLGLDLASVAANMLTGTASRTDPALLGKQTDPVGNAITTQAQTLDLAGLAGSVSTMAQSQGAEDLAAVVGEGLNAASFFASGAHQSYQNLVVDNAGRNAIQWVSDWLNLQITRAA
ncbi:cutinase family protein [Rhodococcus opacus]|uniref:Cutinase family protein n=1 Tax=Rhodococcus opacus TaxID=37919 RepID=A0AAX3YT38_RHOOP|nr:cutinase family protein [Rhodococcus opacus]MCZ4586145.1 cutinase family protein [Rhodococcus opacus]WLF51918.1 cutinase family protein [Rhodococcus opacus]